MNYLKGYNLQRSSWFYLSFLIITLLLISYEKLKNQLSYQNYFLVIFLGLLVILAYFSIKVYYISAYFNGWLGIFLSSLWGLFMVRRTWGFYWYQYGLYGGKKCKVYGYFVPFFSAIRFAGLYSMRSWFGFIRFRFCGIRCVFCRKLYLWECMRYVFFPWKVTL